MDGLCQLDGGAGWEGDGPAASAEPRAMAVSAGYSLGIDAGFNKAEAAAGADGGQ